MQSLEEIVANNARAYQKWLDEKHPSAASTEATLPTPAEQRAYEQGMDDGRLVEQAAAKMRASTEATEQPDLQAALNKIEAEHPFVEEGGSMWHAGRCGTCSRWYRTIGYPCPTMEAVEIARAALTGASPSEPSRCGCECHGPTTWAVCPHCQPDLFGAAPEEERDGGT